MSHSTTPRQPLRASANALIALAITAAAGLCAAATAGPASGPASAPMPSVHAASAAAPGKAASGATVWLVDINSASRKELMTLPGIGAAQADKIVANRPYLTKTELVSKNVLPVGPYVSIKSRIVAMPPAKPKGKG